MQINVKYEGTQGSSITEPSFRINSELGIMNPQDIKNFWLIWELFHILSIWKKIFEDSEKNMYILYNFPAKEY